MRASIPSILDWLPSYTRAEAHGDLLAGLTVGVMLVPQSMAYAVLLGVPPIYGLYASVLPLLIYPLLGTSRHLAVGVIAIDMLVAGSGLALVAEPGSARFITLAIALAFIAGLIQIAMGLLRLGFVVNLLSRPVLAGFMSAAAIIISFSQLDNLLRIELPQSQYVHVILWNLWGSLGDVHFLSAVVGIAGIVILFALKASRPLFPAPIALVVAATLVVWLIDLDQSGVEVVGSIPTGLPWFEFPNLDGRSLRGLIPTAITLALVQFMTVVSLGKTFGARHRYRIDPNSELMAVGMSNVVGSLFHGLPISGSFSRTAVNDKAGGRTPLQNVVAASVVIAVLLFLTPLFAYLPMTVLASIIIFAAVSLVDFKEVRLLVHMKRVDGGIALFTFAATLVAGVLEGILLGIAASVVAIMYRISRPNVAALGHLPGTQTFGDFDRHADARSLDEILILRVDASLSFANAEFLRDIILQRTASEESTPRVITIDATGINDLDTTAVEILLELADVMRSREIELYFGGTKGAVIDVMLRAGLVEKLGRDHFFVSPYEAVRHVRREWESAAEAVAQQDKNP